MHSQPIGRLPASNHLHLAISLPLRNAEALSNLLQQIYDPASSRYHQYLTPAQFTDMFGPTEQDYQAVIAFARSRGLTVTGTHPNRTLVDVVGSVAEVEKACHVKIGVYQHPKEARTYHAPDVEPSLDLSTPVLYIAGLDNYALPRPLIRRRQDSQNSPNQALTGSGPGGNFIGYDFRNAYVPGVALTGAGQTVALLECDGYNASDITSYRTTAGLPNVPLQNVLVDEFNGAPQDADAAKEVCLDIEMAISMAPGLSKIIVYETAADTPAYIYDLLNQIANEDLASQISSSWVFRNDASLDQIFGQFALQGQSFFEASGDQDAYTAQTYQWNDDPYITLVGGTTLTTSGPGGCWVSETVWNWGLVRGRLRRHRGRHQRQLLYPGMATRHQHGRERWLDDHAQRSRCGDDGGWHLCRG